MPTYALLQNPGHNRVYFNASRTLSLHELTVASKRMSVPALHPREALLGGVPYLLFDTDAPLRADDFMRLSRLSFVYALYEVSNHTENPSLAPLPKENFYYFNDDLSMLLKYAGKTNELFTRLMLNLAVSCSPFEEDTDFHILDPLCGKGTTLFESLLLGFHGYGVEVDEKLVHEAYVFLKKYLETARYKHSTHMEKVSGYDPGGQKFTAQKYQVELAKNKTDQQADKTLHVEMVAGDTRYMNTYFKKNTFHAIVGDLPYGVQHGSHDQTHKKNPRGGFTRNALGMLTEALPEWLKVLKPGGVVVLAWNLFLIPRTEMESLFTAHGLALPQEDLFRQLSHRVDQAIDRDVIVGVYKTV